MSLYPLKFKPRLIHKIWGGHKLHDLLHKDVASDQHTGESWEIYDFPPGAIEPSNHWISSTIAEGSLAGLTLHEALVKYRAEIMGDVPLIGPHEQFPLLVKFLDAREDLSVQVHPDTKYCAAHPEAALKNEAWYIVDSTPGAQIYRGLKPGIDRHKFEESIADGTCEEKLANHRVRPGDCFYLPSGTVHALGAGILAAEVQTPSDTTYRVFDFNRVDPSTGKTRALHIEQAMKCINFGEIQPHHQPRSHTASYFTTVTRLVQCDFFIIERVRFAQGVEAPVPYDQPVIWMMLSGQAQITAKGAAPVNLSVGDTVLLPADMKQPVLKADTDCQWLEVTIPKV